MHDTNLESLKQKATFSQSALDAVLDGAKRSYNSAVSFVWTTPQQMIEGIIELAGQGYTASNLMHTILPPGYYQVFMVKPKHVQATELAAWLSKFEQSYYDDLAGYRELYKQELALAMVAEVDAAEAAKLAKARDKRMADALAQAEKEVISLGN